MPDWFFRTLSRPLLYRLRPERARAFALGFMSKLARMPLGRQVIDLLGHMRPDPRLAVKVLGVEFASPVGLGPRLDPACIALPAFERFGIGFADVGAAVPEHVERDDEEFLFRGEERRCDPTRLRMRLPGIVRTEERVARIGESLILILRPEEPDPETRLESAIKNGFVGVLIDGAIYKDGIVITGRSVREAVLEMVKRIRTRFPELPIVAGGGVHEAEDALALLDAGANLIEVDTGLVFNGPGLVKRINEALLHRIARYYKPPILPRPAKATWFWTALLGLGMLIGGVLALLIAGTRVILPYDEAFLGMSREQLRALNPRLPAFMAHDRVSLVGPMLALGTLYLGLSLGGIRRGMHWAMVAVVVSSGTGFASFFLFLGFGYLDPLHAFVTVCLFQLLLLAVHSDLRKYLPPVQPLRTDRAWRRGQWGQLLLVLHAIAVTGAGFVISGVGVTAVFVHEDLEFLQTTTEALTAANPRLVPLVAHDRATFGGMLLASAINRSSTRLWGIGPGRPWLWRTLLVAALVGYLPAIGVHLVVGYTDGLHLLPAFLGLGTILIAIALVKPHLDQ